MKQNESKMQARELNSLLRELILIEGIQLSVFDSVNAARIFFSSPGREELSFADTTDPLLITELKMIASQLPRVSKIRMVVDDKGYPHYTLFSRTGE